jgi:hypothetical protein
VLVVALLAMRLCLSNRSRVDAGELAVAIGLLLLTLTAYRFVLFWAVAMVPVIARAAGEPNRERRTSPAKVLLPILLIAVITPLLAPTRFAETLPLPALERLRREGVHGTIYGDFPFGGAIIDAGYPDWHVAYDGRYYRYARKEWQYNGGIENGIVPLVDVIAKWNPAAFVLDEYHNAPLAGELARSPQWRSIWSQRGIVVYVPRRRR